MRLWPIAALSLCLPAVAASASELFEACRENSSSVAMFYQSLPDDARPAFDRMYSAYARMVSRRTAEGWTHGQTQVRVGSVTGLDLEVGNQVTNWKRSFQEYGIQALWKTALSPESKTALERRISDLQDEFRTATPERRREILSRLADLRKQASLPRGVCEDWAKETAEVARAAAGPGFHVEWREIRRGGHAVAFVTYPERSLCIALDPWYRGLPELVGCDDAEDVRPSETPSCFAVYPPPAG